MGHVRRLPGLCYLCGDPAATGWFCLAHVWAGRDLPELATKENGLTRITSEHAFWIDRLTPTQIVDLAGYLEPAEAA